MEKKNVNILLCGLLVTNGNLGCIALTYSAISILQSVADSLGMTFHYKIVASYIENESIELMCEQLKIDRNLVDGEMIGCLYNSYVERRKFVDLVKNWADLAVDATQGDSFSDIYGWRRFVNYTYAKILIEKNKVPLLLAPQTYGPYKHFLFKKIAKYACENASLIMSRDEISKDVLKNMGINKKIDVVSDMAFFLPYNKQALENASVTNIGLNISGLLWNGGYTNDNQFGLSVDYQRAIRKTIEKIKLNPRYRLFLVGHVIISDENSVEDDYSICRKLSEEYNVECAPRFLTPIEAKSFISGLDVFLGSRMHATIASYSSGVATVSLAYSRKFVGLYNSLNYPYVLDLCDISENELVDKIDYYVKNCKTLESSILSGKSDLEDKKKYFMQEVAQWIEVNNER